jgi:hypothetical protein
VQAWRHLPSHFNTETPSDAFIAYSLAAGGAGLVLVLGSFAVTALRGRIDATPSMRIALRTGFALLLAGLAAGIAMILRGQTLVKAGNSAAAYDIAGYLKWFHGVSLLAILVLPTLAWWLSRTRHSEAGHEARHRRSRGLCAPRQHDADPLVEHFMRSTRETTTESKVRGSTPTAAFRAAAGTRLS